MSKLSEMPNIGAVLTERLVAVGIRSGEDLVALGSRGAFTLLKQADSGTCLNTLYALEGAIRGIRWHHLSDDVKCDLKRYFESEAGGRDERAQV